MDEAAILKNGPNPEKIRGVIDELRPMLARLVEMSEPNNEVHGRVCGNREINIASLESELAKSKGKAIRAAIKKTKKPVAN